MVEDVKQSNTKLLWIVSGVFIFIYFISLLMIKLSNPEFSIGKMILYLLLGLAFVSAIIFGVYHFGKKKIDPKVSDVQKIPNAVDKKTAYKIAQDILREPPYADYFDDNTVKDMVEEVGKGQKTSIYCIVGKGIYVNSTYAVMLNMHVPLERNTVLRNPTDYEMNKYKQLLSFSPEDEPDIERITTENVLTGNKQLVERITKKEEKKNNEIEKKEDLK